MRLFGGMKLGKAPSVPLVLVGGASDDRKAGAGMAGLGDGVAAYAAGGVQGARHIITMTMGTGLSN